MVWNYRIVQEKNYLSIREVFYEKGKIKGWTNKGIAPYGEDLEDLEETYKTMAEAFRAPILKLEDDERGEPTLKEIK